MKITVYRSISNDMYEKLELDLEDEDIIKIGERFLELKNGEWIDLGYHDEFYGKCYQCSVCGEHFLKFNYCPNCGSKMKSTEERDSEDNKSI